MIGKHFLEFAQHKDFVLIEKMVELMRNEKLTLLTGPWRTPSSRVSLVGFCAPITCRALPRWDRAADRP